MTAPSSEDRPGAGGVFGAEFDESDPDADDHEQWLRENVPPHHG